MASQRRPWRKTDNETNEEAVGDDNYGKVLQNYIQDIRRNEIMEQEMKKMEIMEKNQQHSMFDLIFPWHMQLGRFEDE